MELIYDLVQKGLKDTYQKHDVFFEVLYKTAQHGYNESADIFITVINSSQTAPVAGICVVVVGGVAYVSTAQIHRLYSKFLVSDFEGIPLT
jgi:hypothetical protein